jgi:hypothetical protein
MIYVEENEPVAFHFEHCSPIHWLIIQHLEPRKRLTSRPPVHIWICLTGFKLSSVAETLTSSNLKHHQQSGRLDQLLARPTTHVYSS